MSLKLIETETRRFLATTTPEVLCIRGHWGVGKTYAWRKYLLEAKDDGKLAHSSYSYVSLFGLNSLDDLRFSIFENTVRTEKIISGPNIATFHELVSRGINAGRQNRNILDLALAMLNRKSASDILYRTAFMAVRDQLICFDDLERAGNTLTLRDVLGLASFLKEQRGCKVAILLNNEKLSSDEKTEFYLQIEKVADVSIKFDISPEDAANIGILGNKNTDITVKERIKTLRITNIRTVKKIERLAHRLSTALDGFEERTLDQALTTVVLAGWSANEPDAAPTRDFLKSYNSYSASFDKKQVASAPLESWRLALNEYPYTSTDELDLLILDFAYDGYLDEDRLRAAAQTLQDRTRGNSKDNSFTRAWEDLYHGSLATDDDQFLDALYTGARENAKAITPLSINGSIRMLREFGRSQQASRLVVDYIDAHKEEGYSFFNIKNHYYPKGDEIDEELRNAFELQLESITDNRSPLDVLRSMSERQGWDEQDISLIAKQTPSEMEIYLESLRGIDLHRSVDLLLLIGRSNQLHSERILSITTDALLRIAAKSPLRARKVSSFGIELNESGKPD